jgi:hypothetical protein
MFDGIGMRATDAKVIDMSADSTVFECGTMSSDRRTGIGLLFYDRRSGVNRRKNTCSAECEKRSGQERRFGSERRSWIERRCQKQSVVNDRRNHIFNYE